MTQMTLSPRAWAELFALSFIWGASFLAIRVALDEIGPLTVVAHRVGWAAPVLWAYVLMRGMPVPRSARVWAAFLVMGILNNVIPFSLMAWGQLHIESGLTSILNAATAVFGVIAAALFFADERLTPRRMIGVSLGFLGVATAIGLSSLTALDLRSLGQLAVLGGTISYALAGVWARKRLSGLPTQVAAAGMVTSSAVIMIPMAWLFEGPIQLDLDARTWAAICYFAICATAVAYVLYYRVLAMAGSGNLMLCTLLLTPVAIVLGAVILGEELHPQAIIGFAILATGLLILSGRLFPTHPVKDRAGRA